MKRILPYEDPQFALVGWVGVRKHMNQHAGL